MKIGVFGVTGGMGKAFVALALAQGHIVTGLARTPSKLTIEHDALHVVEGDVLDPAAVRPVIDGQDAILVALGGGGINEPTTLRQDGTRHIVDALVTLGQQPHMVVVSSLGVSESRDQMRIPMRWIVPRILRHPLTDHVVQERIVTESALPWTILRPTALSDEEAVHPLYASTPPEKIAVRPDVSRASVAQFALDCIEGRAEVGSTLTLTHASDAT